MLMSFSILKKELLQSVHLNGTHSYLFKIDQNYAKKGSNQNLNFYKMPTVLSSLSLSDTVWKNFPPDEVKNHLWSQFVLRSTVEKSPGVFGRTAHTMEKQCSMKHKTQNQVFTLKTQFRHGHWPNEGSKRISGHSFLKIQGNGRKMFGPTVAAHNHPTQFDKSMNKCVWCWKYQEGKMPDQKCSQFQHIPHKI